MPMKRRLARIRGRNWSDQSVRSLFHGIFILDTGERKSGRARRERERERKWRKGAAVRLDEALL